MATLLKDFQHSLRIASRAPGFTAIVLLSLALGVAANTTIFSAVHAIFLSSPLLRDSDRVVVLWESNPTKAIKNAPVSPGNFRDWRDLNQSFEDMELVAPGSPVTVLLKGVPDRANIQYATPDLFRLLGLQPVLGRSFTREEIKSADPIMIGFGFWQGRFNGASDIAGQHIVINGEVHTIVGVLPKVFHLFDRETDLWMPIDLPGRDSQNRSFRSWLIAVGRLRPGVSLVLAQAEMSVIARQIATAHPESNKDWDVHLQPIQDAQFGSWRPILYLLFGIVVIVLLVSCLNVVNLLLGRLVDRRREFSLRMSLGATRSRIVAQLLAEGIALGVFGGLLGSVLSYWGVDMFRVLAPVDFPLLQAIRINVPILLFCLTVSLICGVGVSVIPALLTSRVDLQEALKSAAGTTSGARHRRFRSALVVGEIAMSVVLLFGAGLMINSFLRLRRIDPGFRADGVATMQIFLAGPKYFVFGAEGVHIQNEVERFYRRLLERIRELPGVESAGIVSWLPEMGYNTGNRDRSFRILGGEAYDTLTQPTAAFNMVSSDYFKTLEIRLRSGRFFAERANGGSPWVALVNESFRHRYCLDADPVGKQIVIEGDPEGRSREIVGLVADVHQSSQEQNAQPEIFTSYLQQPSVVSAHGYQNRVHMTIVVRSNSSTAAIADEIRKLAAQMDSREPIYGMRSMTDVMAESMALWRLDAELMELIAAIAMFLSSIGIYGVVSHSVSQQTGDIGIRMAVGATRTDVFRYIFLQGGSLILLGIVAGVLLSLTLSRFTASHIFGISASDPLTMALASFVLAFVAGIAIWIPARRATLLDPLTALHHE